MTFSDSKSFKNVRIYTYQCLLLCLINTNSLSGTETIANECVKYILKDITPKRDCISFAQPKMQHLSKQAKKRFKHSQYENSAILNNGQNSIKNTFRYRFVQTGSYCFAKHTFQRSVETDILQENLNNLMNFFVRKNQIKEVATTSRSDKRSRTEEELQAVNAFLYKRPKIIATQYIY